MITLKRCPKCGGLTGEIDPMVNGACQMCSLSVPPADSSRLTNPPLDNGSRIITLDQWQEYQSLQAENERLREENATLSGIVSGSASKIAAINSGHRWDKSGERCIKCGDKDWMDTECRPTNSPID